MVGIPDMRDTIKEFFRSLRSDVPRWVEQPRKIFLNTPNEWKTIWKLTPLVHGRDYLLSLSLPLLISRAKYCARLAFNTPPNVSS